MASPKHVIIVGGGLVGAINACFFAKRGFKVDLFESRADIRRHELIRGRSINMALSKRGRDPLRAVDMEEAMVANGIAMYARMIHDLDGTRHPIKYGTKPDEYIMSIDRKRLNCILLDGAEKYEDINFHFEHRFKSCDFDKVECTFQRADGEEVTYSADLIVGTDGAYSSVRRELMKAVRMDFSQEYIPHGYMELCIPAAPDGEFAMEINYLHIWPRNEFMLIALPNVEDKTFVVTLFMPFTIYETLTTTELVLAFFEKNFPDAIPLIGKEELLDAFLSSSPQPLMTVRCQPYHVGGRGVIMGDAAHAMVPFYGQGMNCGFEDTLLFHELLDKYDNDFEKALPAFTEIRNIDAKAMCELALYNYIEMRASVNSKLFLLRKKIDNFLHKLMPNTWIPLYTMVSFTRTRYHQCIENRKWQDKILTRFLTTSVVGMTLGGSLLAWRFLKNQEDLSLSNFLTRVNWSSYFEKLGFQGVVTQ